MNKITNKYILKLISFSILLIVPFLQFFSMYLEKYGIMECYDFINPAIILYICMPILLYIYISDIIKTRRKLDLYDYIFYALVLSSLLSTIFSINKRYAIFGVDYRHEGLLSILSYYLLLINWKFNGTKDDIKLFIKTIIIIGIINSVYSLFQIYTPFTFILRYGKDLSMASGLCGNPNFFGSLIVTVLGLLTPIYFMKKEKTLKILLIIILLFISLINSQSMGPFITYILVFIFLTLFLYKKGNLVLKKSIIVFISLLIAYISIYFINQNINLSKSNEISLNGLNETIKSGGNGRIDIWKNSIDIAKDNLLVGVGYDNFELAYPNPKVEHELTIVISNGIVQRQKPSSNNKVTIIDNAHNIYLQLLVTTGVLGLIPYLILCLFTFIKCIKGHDKYLFILTGAFVAYSIQAFANINVIEVAPIYYLIIGLILSIKE